MNNRENDDELERMRARARRGSGRQDGGRQSSRAYPKPVLPAGERRSARQSYDGREEYDEEYYYGYFRHYHPRSVFHLKTPPAPQSSKFPVLHSDTLYTHGTRLSV